MGRCRPGHARVTERCVQRTVDIVPLHEKIVGQRALPGRADGDDLAIGLHGCWHINAATEVATEAATEAATETKRADLAVGGERSLEVITSRISSSNHKN